jgi:hypothetical protein
MNADDQGIAKVEAASTLATGQPLEDLDHRVMAHELVLACLVEHIAESEPRFLERLRYRFSRVAAADSEIVSAATYAHRMVDKIDAMLREASIPPGRRVAPPGPRVTGRVEDFAARASETDAIAALLDVGEGTIKTMALPAGVGVELTASSWPDAVGGHRWVVDVCADTWDPEKRETKLHYTSTIGRDEPEQRIEIPKQDVDCIFRISAAHRTDGGWEADEPHVAVNRQSWVAIGFGAPNLPAVQPDALVLAFRFKT